MSMWRWRRCGIVLAVVAIIMLAGGVFAFAAEHHEDEHDDEHDSTVTARLVYRDRVNNQVVMIDLPSYELVARMWIAPEPGLMVSSADGRYVFVVNSESNLVTMIDTGLSLEAHGDHFHRHTGPPYIAHSLPTGNKPVHLYLTYGGNIAVGNDDDGVVSIIDPFQANLTLQWDDFGAGDPDHIGIGFSPDPFTIYAGKYYEGSIHVIDAETGITESVVEGCPALHGEAYDPATRQVYFACDKHVLVVGTTGESRGKAVGRIPYPAQGRPGVLYTHPKGGYIVGNFDGGLLVVDTRAAQARFVAIPDAGGSPTLDLSADGSVALVRTKRGTVAKVDLNPVSAHFLEVTRTLRLGTLSEETAGADRKDPPEVAISPDGKVAYTSLPAEGQIAVVDVDHMEVVKMIEVGGKPTRLLVVEPR